MLFNKKGNNVILLSFIINITWPYGPSYRLQMRNSSKINKLTIQWHIIISFLPCKPFFILDIILFHSCVFPTASVVLIGSVPVKMLKVSANCTLNS